MYDNGDLIFENKSDIITKMELVTIIQEIYDHQTTVEEIEELIKIFYDNCTIYGTHHIELDEEQYVIQSKKKNSQKKIGVLISTQVAIVHRLSNLLNPNSEGNLDLSKLLAQKPELLREIYNNTICFKHLLERMKTTQSFCIN